MKFVFCSDRSDSERELPTGNIVRIVFLAFALLAAAPLRAQPTAPTVEAFKKSVRAGGWSILNVTNMAGILSEKGYTLRPVLVFDACGGKYSAELLAHDETRFIAPMIPCRVAIYQRADGKVVITRMNSVAMAGFIGGKAADIVRKSGEEIEAIIAATLRKLKS